MMRGTTSTGREGAGWVETFRLGCSRDGDSFLFATESGILEADIEDAYVFAGNADGTGIVTNDLNNFGLDCRHFRFYPQNVTGSGATALDLVGSKL